jgi:hypothetical protein
VFVLFASVYLLTGLGQIESDDGEMMYRVTASLIDRHSLEITDEIFHASEPYAVYGLGTSFLAIPLYLAGMLVSGDTHWFVSLFNPIVTATTVALPCAAARRLRFSREIGLFLAFSLDLGSLAWPATKTFFSKPLTTFASLRPCGHAIPFVRAAARSHPGLSVFRLASPS